MAIRSTTPGSRPGFAGGIEHPTARPPGRAAPAGATAPTRLVAAAPPAGPRPAAPRPTGAPPPPRSDTPDPSPRPAVAPPIRPGRRRQTRARVAAAATRRYFYPSQPVVMTSGQGPSHACTARNWVLVVIADRGAGRG